MKVIKRLKWAAAGLLLAAAPVFHATAQESENPAKAQVRVAIEAKDYRRAFELLKPLAAAGDIPSQFLLGYAHFDGVGTIKNQDEAAKWFERAAAAGHGNAQYMLGWMYLDGVAYPKNEEVAAELFEKAALQGVPEAQYRLGRLLDPAPVEIDEYSTLSSNPSSLKKDAIAAASWYRMAADEGIPEAQFSLALAYQNGRGVTKNATEALKLYRLAAKQGLGSAQHNLAVMYYNGEAVARDISKSYMWMVIAAATGYRSSVVERNALAEEVTPAIARNAEAAAARCVESNYVGCD